MVDFRLRQGTKRFVFLLFALLLSFIPTEISLADQSQDCAALPLVEWSEKKTQYFAILQPSGLDENIAQIFNIISPQLDPEYTRLSSLFQKELTVPITLRIYPNQTYYSCLNAMAPALRKSEYHVFTGLREISFVSDRFPFQSGEGDGDIQNFPVTLINDVRYELTNLFVADITDHTDLPGLLEGVSIYAEDPAQLYLNTALINSGYDKPSQTWRYIWENPNTENNELLKQNSVSIVSYLIDAYGWPKFLQFLNVLATSDGYRQALNQVYGVEFTDLEQEWETYYPLYLQDRWRVNAIYNFDLSRYKILINNGAYSDAILGLNDAIDFLKSIQQNDKEQAAQQLLEEAKIGQEASILVSESRQALQSKDYSRSIDLATQAEDKFQEIGNNPLENEISAYKSLSEEILSLKAQLQDLLSKKDQPDVQPPKVDEMIRIGNRLAQLGDDEDYQLVKQYLRDLEIKSKERNEQDRLTFVEIVLGLLFLRILLIFVRRPLEVI